MRQAIRLRLAAILAGAALAAGACSADDPSTAATTEVEQTVSTATTVASPTMSAPGPSTDRDRAGRVPASYDDVSPDYDAAYAQALATGREAVDAFLADPAAFYARFSDDLKATITEDEVEAIGREARTDRVHFEWPQGGTFFDGRLSEGTISGHMSFGTMVGAFSLTPSPSAGTAAPPAGLWEGEVVIDEAVPPDAFSVTFTTAGEKLEATVDVPAEGVSSQPLANVTYEPVREIGERLAESVVLRSSESVYRSQHAWGPWSLVLTLGFSDDGTITSLALPYGQPSLHHDPAEGATDTRFELPFDGTWLVVSGGPSLVQNHHVIAPSQRYGYDLAVWNEGATHDGAGTRNEDYWAWEQPVLAPANGTVVSVLDGVEDNTPPVTAPESHPAGNHVVLETGGDEYLFLAHFKKGSIRVVEGDRVTIGDVLGLTGNSGNSFEPHIHIHLQDEKDFFSQTAVGLPLPFTGYLANGQPVPVDSPVQGQLVQDDNA